MVSLFYARHYPAGREANPRSQPVPNDTPVSDRSGPPSTGSQLSDVPPADVPDPSQSGGQPPATNTISIPDRGQQPSRGSPLAPSPTPSQLPEQYNSTPAEKGPAPANFDSPHSGIQKRDSASSSPQPTQTDYFVPSSAFNSPQPMTTQTFGTDATPTSTIVSTQNLSASSLPPVTLQSTPTVVPTHGGALSTGSSSNKKHIIGGAVGGGILIMIILALLLFCCRNRRAKSDLERSGGGHSEGQLGDGQFACCNHGTHHRNNGQRQRGEKGPLKPLILKSDSATLTHKKGQRHTVSLNRRESNGSQKSGSDASTYSSYSSDSADSQHSRRRSQKRPPPLKLTSLVTPVIHGPQDNPRHGVDDRSSLPNTHTVPTIVVEPPQPTTPDRMGRH